jgi:MoaA/NifB/PqqE/SkfB family radical SAM enzyme
MSFITKLKIIRQYWPISKFYFNYLFRRYWPLHSLIFQVTNKCNSRCLTCFNWQIINTETEELSLSEIENLTRSIGTMKSITLGGGEPFLRPDLPEICGIFYRLSGTGKFSIPTNCLLPDLIETQVKKILDTLPIKLKVVLSLDGIGEVHDNIRGVKGNFERFLETYGKLAEISKKNEQLQVSINSTISDKNMDNVKAIIEFIDQRPNIRYHTLEVIRGSFDKSKIKTLDLEQYDKMFKQVLFTSKTLARDPAHKLFYSYYHGLARRIMKHKRQVVPCRSAAFSPMIDAWGNVYLCEMLPRIGNLRYYDYDIKKILFSPAAMKQRQFIRDKKCWCTHYCYQLPNIIMSPWQMFKALFWN